MHFRSDFQSLPFQAVECCLANVKPVNSKFVDCSFSVMFMGHWEACVKVLHELLEGQVFVGLESVVMPSRAARPVSLWTVILDR